MFRGIHVNQGIRLITGSASVPRYGRHTGAASLANRQNSIFNISTDG